MNVWFIPQQLLTAAFLRSMLLGIAVGVLYDLLRAPRRAFVIGQLGTILLDAVFVFGLLLLVFIFFVVAAYGVPRGWFACGIVLGALLYFRTLSVLVLLLVVTVLTIGQKVFVRTAAVLSQMMKFIAKLFCRICTFEKLRKKRKFLFHFRTK